MEYTKREIKILKLLSEGNTKDSIQDRLAISKLTLDKDLAVLKAKFNAFNLPNLIYLATKQNVI